MQGGLEGEHVGTHDVWVWERRKLFDVRSRACGLVDLEQVGTTSYTETTLLLRIERPAAAAFKGRCLLLLSPLSEAFVGGNGGGVNGILIPHFTR